MGPIENNFKELVPLLKCLVTGLTCFVWEQTCAAVLFYCPPITTCSIGLSAIQFSANLWQEKGAAALENLYTG